MEIIFSVIARTRSGDHASLQFLMAVACWRRVTLQAAPF